MLKPCCIQHESGVLCWNHAVSNMKAECWNHAVSNMKAESYFETIQYPTWKRSLMLKPCSIQLESGVLCWNHAVSNMKSEFNVETMLYPTWKQSLILKPCCIQHERCVLCWNHAVYNMEAVSYVETMLHPTWQQSFMSKPFCIQHESGVICWNHSVLYPACRSSILLFKPSAVSNMKMCWIQTTLHSAQKPIHMLKPRFIQHESEFICLNHTVSIIKSDMNV